MLVTKTQGIRLDDNCRARLKKLGELRERSMNYLIRDAVERYLTEEEQYEKEKIEDLRRYQKYLDTGESVSYSEMKKWLQKKVHKASKRK